MDEGAAREWLIERQPAYRALLLEHMAHEDRLSDLLRLSYRDPGQQEEIRLLKKRKLRLKDAMQAMVDRYLAHW